MEAPDAIYRHQSTGVVVSQPLTTSAGLENTAITCVLRNHFPVEFGHCLSLFTQYVKVDSCPDYPSTGFNLKTYVKIKQTAQKLFDIVIVILKSPIPEQWEHTLGQQYCWTEQLGLKSLDCRQACPGTNLSLSLSRYWRWVVPWKPDLGWPRVRAHFLSEPIPHY